MDSKFIKWALVGTALVVLLDLIILNYYTLIALPDVVAALARGQSTQTHALSLNILRTIFPPGKTKTTLSPTPTLTKTSTASAQCDGGCTAVIQAESKRLEQLINAKITGSQQAAAQTQPVREYFIPLGAGSATSDAWQDVNGTETVINTANYGGTIRESYLEAVVYTPTKNGKAYVRLYNATDNLPIPDSTMSTDQSTPTKLTTPIITLSPGNKVYRVQMSNTLKYEVKLDFARLRMLVQ